MKVVPWVVAKVASTAGHSAARSVVVLAAG